MLCEYIYIYVVSRHFYSGYTFFAQYVINIDVHNV